MADDVLINKAAAIERAGRRVREERAGDDRNLTDNQTRQDAIILNLQRACESSIDAAMHLVRVHRLGGPQETREALPVSGFLAEGVRRCNGGLQWRVPGDDNGRYGEFPTPN